MGALEIIDQYQFLQHFCDLEPVLAGQAPMPSVKIDQLSPELFKSYPKGPTTWHCEKGNTPDAYVYFLDKEGRPVQTSQTYQSQLSTGEVKKFRDSRYFPAGRLTGYHQLTEAFVWGLKEEDQKKIAYVLWHVCFTALRTVKDGGLPEEIETESLTLYIPPDGMSVAEYHELYHREIGYQDNVTVMDDGSRVTCRTYKK